eukprot:jgi/Astpho2/2908/Aster-01056
MKTAALFTLLAGASAVSARELLQAPAPAPGPSAVLAPAAALSATAGRHLLQAAPAPATRSLQRIPGTRQRRVCCKRPQAACSPRSCPGSFQRIPGTGELLAAIHY